MTDDIARAREPVCRGDLLLGTACRRCARCKAERERLRSLAQQVEEMEKERDHYMNFAVVDAGSNTTVLWKDRALASEAKLASVREALEPFSQEAANYDYGDGSGPDLKDAPDQSSLWEVNDLKVGDLRRAREALSLLGEE
jgi:hypothetical protein